jgi:glyoxylase-like metal-dependent hydrolase (beta-lactamase superfamily II)
MKLPNHLAQNHASGEQPGEVIAQYEIGNSKNFVYLILDWKHQKAVIVDPQSDLRPLLNCLDRYQFQLEGILLTHSHFDHIAGIPKLSQLFPEVPVYVHPQDQHRLAPKKSSPGVIIPLQDETVISLGDLKIQTLHTPGHSAGECCFFIASSKNYLLTGDTLFIRDCGRTDLESGSNEDMFQSLQKIRTLPSDTIILPGHHYQPECASFLQDELRMSPPFQSQSLEELAQLPRKLTFLFLKC